MSILILFNVHAETDSFNFVLFSNESKERTKSIDKTSSRPVDSPGPDIGPNATWKSITQIPTAVLMGIRSKRLQKSNQQSQGDSSRSYSYEEIIQKLATSVQVMFPNEKSTKKLLQRCLLHTGIERGRALVFSNHDLRHMLQFRFNLPLDSTSIDNIFARFDAQNTGEIRVRALFKEVVNYISQKNDSTQGFPRVNADTPPATPISESTGSDADIFPTTSLWNATDTSALSGALVPLAADSPPSMPVEQLEEMIFQRVKQRVIHSDFHQAFLKCFNESRRKDKNYGISVHQMVYTLRYKFRFGVTDGDIAALFAKHSEAQSIPMVKFVNYLVSTFDKVETLVEDNVFRTTEMMNALVANPDSLLHSILEDIRYACENCERY
jgi:hypothetical protein